MIVVTILTIALFILTVFIGFLNSIFGAFPSLPLGPDGVGYVFGNIYLLNSFLPVSDLFILASFALTWKTILFTFEVTMFTLSLMNTVRRTFTQIRV